MPEMSKRFKPKHLGDTNPNPKLIKLMRKITDRIPAKIKGITTNDPEYWGPACIFEDEMDKETREASLDLLLKMVSKKPMTVRAFRSYELLHKWNKKHHYTKDDKSFDELLDKLSLFGLIEYDYGDKYTKDGPMKDAKYNREDRRYWVPLFVPGSGEYTNMSTYLIEKHPELAMFFERMTFLPLEHITAMVPPGGAGIGMHVIPVEKAIEMENKTIDIEKISYWLKRYEGHISASICSCRLGRGKLEEGCADDFNDWCIAVGDMADYVVETNRGRHIDYKEAMEIFKRAEDNGFVHQVTNIDGEDKIFAICNCNVKICNALRTSQLFNTPNMSRSSFVADVDKTKCVACGRCVEYCPAGALKLGQKLCNKKGKELTYPKQELPDDVKWGEDKWSEDYRDKNRINCHETGTSPCKTACPAHVAVQGYLKKAAEGKYDEALALIKKENPFPAICGRVCNHPCEDACTRGQIDEPLAIEAVKRFIAEMDLNKETRYIPPVVLSTNRGKWKDKIAIIGAGPAGLSCAYYLATLGYSPTVFEKEAYPGGAMRYGIPSYKLEKNIIDAEIEVIRQLGVEIKCNTEVGKDITIQQLRNEGYKAFYIAIGCSKGNVVGTTEDPNNGIYSALTFLHDYNQGDKKLSGKVVVIGGGNVAIDAARVAKRVGAEQVDMYSLETEDISPANKIEIEEAREDKVNIHFGYGLKEVKTEGHKQVEIIKCTRVYDENKKFNPTYDINDVSTIDADIVIFAVGQSVDWGNLLDGIDIDLRKNKLPLADGLTYQTKVKDIFVGGDVYSGPKFVINAIAMGHEASESLHRFVRHAHMTIGRNRREFIALNKDDITVPSYDHNPREHEAIDNAQLNRFKDNRITLTIDQIKKETARCLGCGATIVDQNRCIGCGICTTKCAFDAIKLHRDRPECSTMIKTEDKAKALIPYLLKRNHKIRVKRRQMKKLAK